MNRGLEISADAADAANSLILDQVAAGRLGADERALPAAGGGRVHRPAYGRRGVTELLITGADLAGAGRAIW